jgi:DNA polymerase delta subunit 4
MPTTRRKSAGTAKGRSKAPAKPNQSKLAFHGPISKPTGHDTLDKKSAAAVEKAEKAEAPVAEPILIPEKSTAAATSAAATTTSDLDEEVFPPGLSTLELDEEEMEAWRAAVRKARGIGEARIEEYWEAKERERITPRVHQEGMSMHDKLLADWDVDSRYGVSILLFFFPDFCLPFLKSIGFFCGDCDKCCV